MLECVVVNLSWFCVGYFTGEDTAKHAKAGLRREMDKMEETLHRASTKESASLATESAEKVPRIEAAGPSRRQNSLTSLYDNILEEHEEPVSGSTKECCYQNGNLFKRIIFSDTPFQYWGNSHARFPILAATTVKFLSTP